MLVETLTKIGLSKKEAKIYLACLELGEAGPAEIARKSDIKRTTIYDLIEKMVHAGYIKVTTKGKRRKFVAIDPKALKKIIQKREALLNEILPELSQVNNTDSIKPKIWTYQGKNGLLQAYEDSLNYPSSEVVGWASGEVVKLFGKKECEKYIEKRLHKKVMQRLIMPKEKETKELIESNNRQLRKTKLVDFEEYPFNIEINIYANKVAMFSSKEKMAVILESKPMAMAMRMIFRMCWKV